MQVLPSGGQGCRGAHIEQAFGIVLLLKADEPTGVFARFPAKICQVVDLMAGRSVQVFFRIQDDGPVFVVVAFNKCSKGFLTAAGLGEHLVEVFLHEVQTIGVKSIAMVFNE